MACARLHLLAHRLFRLAIEWQRANLHAHPCVMHYRRTDTCESIRLNVPSLGGARVVPGPCMCRRQTGTGWVVCMPGWYCVYACAGLACTCMGPISPMLERQSRQQLPGDPGDACAMSAMHLPSCSTQLFISKVPSGPETTILVFTIQRRQHITQGL